MTDVKRKKTGRSPWLQSFLVRFFAAYMAWVYRTTRWEFHGTEGLAEDVAAGRPRIFCLWHARLAMASYLHDWPPNTLAVLASYHPDAQILTKGLEPRGISTVALQTSGENTGAVKTAVRLLRKGVFLGVTPDGPMGPACVVKPGAVTIAALSGAPVSALAYAVRRSLRLPTWDKFVLPLPYGRGVFVVSPTWTVPKRLTEAELAAEVERLEAALNQVTAEADRLVKAKR